MKKIICAVLAAVILASLCACGGDFVGGGDTFTVDRARIRDAWAATGASYIHTEYKTIVSYYLFEFELQVEGVYKSYYGDEKAEITIDLSDYQNGAFVVYSSDGVADTIRHAVEINSKTYYVELFLKIKKQTDMAISVKDLGECYELLYYSYDSDLIKDEYEGNISEIYTDKDGVLEAFTKHSIITAKENVILYTDFD